MGTRCLTRVIQNGKHVMNMYRQFDGYLSGHGLELAKFLEGKPIINGYQSSDQKAFNGAGCLAAGIVAHFKDGIGGIYLYPSDSTDCGQDYEYVLLVSGELDAPTLSVQVFGYEGLMFDGSAEQFLAYCQRDDEEDKS